MSIFYFDEKLKNYEDSFQWDKALDYLESLYGSMKSSTKVLNSLVGFSWFYLIEGPIVSRQYSTNQSKKPLIIWKKYIDLGVKQQIDNYYYCFIAGYTLSLHGEVWLQGMYKEIGHNFLRQCLKAPKASDIYRISEIFLKNELSAFYSRLDDAGLLCTRLFDGKSILEEDLITFFSS